jgi:hypothetical protein
MATVDDARTLATVLDVVRKCDRRGECEASYPYQGPVAAMYHLCGELEGVGVGTHFHGHQYGWIVVGVLHLAWQRRYSLHM